MIAKAGRGQFHGAERLRLGRVSLTAKAELMRAAGPVRTIPLGKGTQPMAMAPDDADFAQAAIWRIELPANLDLSRDPLLRIHYVGDVARVTLNGRLLDDNFFNGKAFDLGLKRFAPEILNGDLRLEILPLQKHAPIYLADEARPDFGKSDRIAQLRRLEIINHSESRLVAAP